MTSTTVQMATETTVVQVVDGEATVVQTGVPVTVTTTGGGGGVTDATYVTLSTNGTLTDERVLTAGTGITITDAGAGSTVTVGVTANTYQPLDSDLTAIAALSTTSFGRGLLALADAAAARTALGLGGAATLNVGTTTGTVAAGDDSRFTDSRTPSGSAGGDLTGTYPNPTIGTGKVTSTNILDGTIVNADISASAAIALSKLATDPLARANHTGTQTASTISDFDTQVATTAVVKSTVTTKGDLIAATGSAAVARVGVGSNNKFLVADSTQTAGINWTNAVPATGDSKVGSTTYYCQPGWIQSGIGTSGLAPRWQYFLFYLPTSATCDQIAIEQTAAAAAGKLYRIGLIAADKWWQPTGSALIDSGTFAADGANGVKTYTPGTPVVLAPGRYLGIVATDGSPTIRIITGCCVAGQGYQTGIGGSAINTSLTLSGKGTAALDNTAYDTVVGSTVDRNGLFLRFSDPAP